MSELRRWGGLAVGILDATFYFADAKASYYNHRYQSQFAALLEEKFGSAGPWIEIALGLAALAGGMWLASEKTSGSGGGGTGGKRNRKTV